MWVYRACDALEVLEVRHGRARHSKGSVDDARHINGVGIFRNEAKQPLSRLNGLPTLRFHLHLAEC